MLLFFNFLFLGDIYGIMIYENLFNILNYERDIVKCCWEILKIFEKKMYNF